MLAVLEGGKANVGAGAFLLHHHMGIAEAEGPENIQQTKQRRARLSFITTQFLDNYPSPLIITLVHLPEVSPHKL